MKLNKELLAKNGSDLDADNCDDSKSQAVITSDKC
jgi:hypothetical protein